MKTTAGGRSLAWLAGLALAAGCLAPSDAVFAVGEASPACGPADGPAVSIQLVSRNGEKPLVPPMITIWLLDVTRETIAPGRWNLGGASQASAVYCTSMTGRCQDATAGSLRLDRVAIPGQLTGRVDLDFPALGRVRGSFTADWVQRGTICG